MLRVRPILLVLAVLALGTLALTGCSITQSADQPVESPQKDVAPAFSGTTFKDKEVSLSDYRGKVVFLNFWASWCGPCRRETPMLERMWKDFQKEGTDVVFLGVNIQDTKGNAQAFIDEFRLTYTNVFDPPAMIAFKYGVTALPSTFVIDKNGQLAERFIGALEEPLTNEAALRDLVQQLAKEG